MYSFFIQYLAYSTTLPILIIDFQIPSNSEKEHLYPLFLFSWFHFLKETIRVLFLCKSLVNHYLSGIDVLVFILTVGGLVEARFIRCMDGSE